MSQTLLIFDLDGTLIDSRNDLATAVNLVRCHYGLPPLTPEAVGRYVGDGIRNLVKRSLEGAHADLDEAVGLQRKFYSEHMHDVTTLYPGVESGLRELHGRGFTLAAASNKQAAFCERILEHFKIRALFSHVAGDGNSPDLKPHPGMFLDIMKRVGATASCTWAIGDNHTDLEAARRAGIRSVFMTYGFGVAGAEKPDRLCSSFGELVAMLAE
jgi:phosphoglycolate phosphatase